ncbi:hypothetical protein ACQ86O_09610 [Serratia sp. L9]|uniref:hypothetical protein n=1 Tax=Serratia sp. L9 TaxID=3423946 RepID=UPI003D672257
MYEIIDQDVGGIYKAVLVPRNELAQLSRLEAGDSLFDCTVLVSQYMADFPTPSSEEGFLASGRGYHDLVFKYQGLFWATRVSVEPGNHPWSDDTYTVPVNQSNGAFYNITTGIITPPAYVVFNPG